MRYIFNFIKAKSAFIQNNVAYCEASAFYNERKQKGSVKSGHLVLQHLVGKSYIPENMVMFIYLLSSCCCPCSNKFISLTLFQDGMLFYKIKKYIKDK